ncbi:hypothetical protein ACVWW2_004237 [Bradyrhizobium sp. LM4.3]
MVADEEGLATGLVQGTRNLLGTAAIGVGLDHRRAFGWHRGLLELAPVGDDGVKVDGEHAAEGSERGSLIGLRGEKAGLRDHFRVGRHCHDAVLRKRPLRFNPRNQQGTERGA